MVFENKIKLVLKYYFLFCIYINDINIRLNISKLID